MVPFKKVPLFKTTAFVLMEIPMLVLTPTTLFFSTTISSTTSCQKSKFGICSKVSLQVLLNNMRSHCALGLHIAGPLDLFSNLNCMALLSVIIPVHPPSASISLTICPFAIPPIAGLQLI